MVAVDCLHYSGKAHGAVHDGLSKLASNFTRNTAAASKACNRPAAQQPPARPLALPPAPTLPAWRSPVNVVTLKLGCRASRRTTSSPV